MAAITDYNSLTAAINDWAERSYASSLTDSFIGLAEGEFRIYLGPQFAMETSATLTLTDGQAALPAGYVRAIALTHSTYGPLLQTGIASVRARRIGDSSGVPDEFAVTSSYVEVAPSYTGNLTFDYEGTLAGLSSGNPTNWLITNAPQAYLSMCLHFAKAREEDANAGVYKAAALKTLDDLGIQSMVATHSAATLRIPGMTP